MTPHERLGAAIRARSQAGDIAIVPYLTAGWPRRAGFVELLREVAEHADAVEIGVPFSDPMADGPVIQATSREALEQGVHLGWILEALDAAELSVPTVLMGYVNPMLAYGLERLVADAGAVGVCGFVVPDLPLEESGELRGLCAPAGLACVQLVTPVTADDRLRRIAAVAQGFLYAVTTTGVTGSGSASGAVGGYLSRIRAASPIPVCAGFGVATRADVDALRGHADGAIVGTALLRALRDGLSAGSFLAGLRR